MNLDNAIRIRDFRDVDLESLLYINLIDNVSDCNRYEIIFSYTNTNSAICKIDSMVITGYSYITLFSYTLGQLTLFETDLSWIEMFVLPKKFYPQYYI